jgi:hypothetical protein
MLFLFSAKSLSYSGFLYEVNVFKMSSKLSLVREERCFVLFVLMEKFSKTNVISMRRHGPHSEAHWATLCSALLHSTHVTGYHVLPAFNHLQGPSFYLCPKSEQWLYHGLDYSWFDSRAGSYFLFSEPSIPSLGPNQPPFQWVLVTFSPLVKRPGREGTHSPLSGTKHKNKWSFTTIPPCIASWGGSGYHIIWCIVTKNWVGFLDICMLCNCSAFETEQKQTLTLQPPF